MNGVRERVREYVRRARVAVAAHEALESYGERSRAASTEQHETPEYLALNGAAWDAAMALPPGTRSLVALDLFAAADRLARRRRAAH